MKTNKRGISLIVLVITIIVMIILAAAIILSLNSAGIIGKANQGPADYNSAQNAQRMLVLESEWELAKSEGTESSLGKTKSEYILKEMYDLEIGDKILYDDGLTEEEGHVDVWYVLGTENGKILLLSGEKVGDNVELLGNEVYKNAVSILDAHCAPWGEGNYASGARSIKAEDINALVGFNPDTMPTRSGDEEIGTTGTYVINNDGTYNYTNSKTGSVLNVDPGIDGFRTLTGVKLNPGETFSEKNTSYKYNINYPLGSSAYKTSLKAINMLCVDVDTTAVKDENGKENRYVGQPDGKINSSDVYWLATPSVMAKSKGVSWGLLDFEPGSAKNNGTIAISASISRKDYQWHSNRGTADGNSTNNANHAYFAVRAVVYLDAGVELVKTDSETLSYQTCEETVNVYEIK